MLRNCVGGNVSGKPENSDFSPRANRSQAAASAPAVSEWCTAQHREEPHPRPGDRSTLREDVGEGTETRSSLRAHNRTLGSFLTS
jgi:hypothetical protein